VEETKKEKVVVLKDNMIELTDVYKIYKTEFYEVYALNGVTMEIREGEFVAIMGPSGSGKSTLLNMIGCLDKPSTGEVIINGVKTSKLRESLAGNLSTKYIEESILPLILISMSAVMMEKNATKHVGASPQLLPRVRILVAPSVEVRIKKRLGNRKSFPINIIKGILASPTIAEAFSIWYKPKPITSDEAERATKRLKTLPPISLARVILGEKNVQWMYRELKRDWEFEGYNPNSPLGRKILQGNFQNTLKSFGNDIKKCFKDIVNLIKQKGKISAEELQTYLDKVKMYFDKLVDELEKCDFNNDGKVDWIDVLYMTDVLNRLEQECSTAVGKDIAKIFSQIAKAGLELFISLAVFRLDKGLPVSEARRLLKWCLSQAYSMLVNLIKEIFKIRERILPIM